MDATTVRQRLNVIFQDIFDDPSLTVRDSMMAADVEGWDSISHINLVVAVENAFAIRLTTAEVRGLNNVGDLLEIIVKKAV